jgi:hypothetical protein
MPSRPGPGIEALRGEFTDAVMMLDGDRLASLFTPDAPTGIATSPWQPASGATGPRGQRDKRSLIACDH